MAVPKTTETRFRDGSVQARQGIKGLHKQPYPYIFFFLPHGIDVPKNSHSNSQNNFKQNKDVGMGLLV